VQPSASVYTLRQLRLTEEQLPPLDARPSEANDPLRRTTLGAKAMLFSEGVLMKRFRILLFLLVACFATAMLAQTPASALKPDPALKKLGVLVGHWT
jgi:hypothetical protein